MSKAEIEETKRNNALCQKRLATIEATLENLNSVNGTTCVQVVNSNKPQNTQRNN